ncbi:MAG TPA: tyrosine--tRNA ligase [Bacteroidetes bacterium]|nr:tyrosine--tRNA ligase [Bacteroidota bacterium]
MFPPLNEQLDLIRRGVSEIIPEEVLVKKIEKSLQTKRPLNVKLGCDPSRPDLHLGHSVVLRKLRQFQDLGHQAILIVGDFTGMIGDPSGRSKTRPPLTLEETRKNGQTYFEQATKILSTKKIQMLYNSEWLSKMSFADVIMLGSRYTVARMLERDDFEKRYEAGEPISIHEMMYPLAQAMDSVAINADVELGGTDQKFNLLVGRDIQREYGLEPQVAITMPILVGTDGVDKMSKSLDNYIGISESPRQIYGKTLSIPDNLIYDYFVLATSVPLDELAKVKGRLDDKMSNPRDVKRELARTLVALYHDEDAARGAEEEFDRVFVKKDLPDEIPECSITLDDDGVNIVRLLTETKLVGSNGEGRRMIEQGGVTVDGQRISDYNALVQIREGVIVKVGKRRFLRVIRAQASTH